MHERAGKFYYTDDGPTEVEFRGESGGPVEDAEDAADVAAARAALAQIDAGVPVRRRDHGWLRLRRRNSRPVR
ncbi:hypothetical protein ACFY3U_04070 [Micromonospora sp. NPDC000089]|uniref:hypothetical protein n=1 Tax=unclassified Micromonospora TaxID=2617518 RepID=UPI003685F643